MTTNTDPRPPTRNWREPLPDWVYTLNGLIRAAQERLDYLNGLMLVDPSASLSRTIAAQERKVADLNARHPDHREATR